MVKLARTVICPTCLSTEGLPCYSKGRDGQKTRLSGAHQRRTEKAVQEDNRKKRDEGYRKARDERDTKVKAENDKIDRVKDEAAKVEAAKVTPIAPHCPKNPMHGRMVERKNAKDQTAFWGCAKYPECTATRSITKKEEPKKEEPKKEDLADEVVRIITAARKISADHGMALPIGYRTTKHIAALAATFGSADEAWKLWIDGRVNETDRVKFTAAGLPGGSFMHATSNGNPGWYETVAKVIDADLPVFLVGEAGTGKTRFAQWYAARVKKPLYTVVGCGDMAGRELWVARRDVTKGNVTTVPGAAAQAAENGGVLLLDEVDGFDANALLPLNAMLNGDPELTAPILGTVKVDPECRIIAAANTNGRNKDRAYAARNRLDGAFLNRFAVVIRVTFDRTIDEKVARTQIAEFFEKKKAKTETVKTRTKKKTAPRTRTRKTKVSKKGSK